ncbi:MAG: fibronectin type III domain-containing protein [Lewinellaceae bacterium]|nr:fibronectin type III domain-containing protein [Lewinellaceae bacterium]
MNRILLLLPLALLFFFSGNLMAQRTCAAEEVLHQEMQQFPELRSIRDAIEQQTRDFIEHGGAHDRVVVTIPVVVHVVYYNGTQNISDAAILSQIDVLNADFRRLNADAANTPSAFQSVAADCEVNFCMATQDPSGAATTGIERRQTTVNGFSTNNAVKYYAQGGLNAWTSSKYLNLWVCNLSGGLLGYAQFPGGAAATDGVVCDYAYFGTIGSTPPFQLGRTATHEVGHWLNCYHIWGDDGTSCSGTDQVADTPNQADENYGCPSFPTISCSNGPNGDMFMNYMDYTDDGCMNLFTTGQKARMQALFAPGGARYSLLSSPGCQPPSGGGSCGTPSGLSAGSITQNSAALSWGTVSGATSYNLQWKVSTAGTWTTVTGLSSAAYSLSGLSANTTYNFQVQAVCGGTSGSYSGAASFNTLSSSSCSDAYESNNSRSTAKVIPVNTDISAQIATASDLDWYRFSEYFRLPET